MQNDESDFDKEQRLIDDRRILPTISENERRSFLDRRSRKKNPENDEDFQDTRLTNELVWDTLILQKEETRQIRDSLIENKSDIKVVNQKVDNIHSTVQTLSTNINDFVGEIKRSIPESNAHLLAHVKLDEDNKKAAEKADEIKKLKQDIRHKVILAIAQGLGIALLAIIGLGLQSQFSIWVNKTVDAPKATVEVKK